MEQQRRDCALVFPLQGDHDGHAFVFRFLNGINACFFYVGEGRDGEVNKLSGDGLSLGDQLELIRQFCKNPNLKHLRVSITHVDYNVSYKFFEVMFWGDCYLLWTTLMRELQGSASLEYIELWDDLPSFPRHGELLLRPLVEMLGTNSSLLGLKIYIADQKAMDLVSFMKIASTHKTLQILQLVFYGGGSKEMELLTLFMASFIPDSTGHQSNMTLRALFMNFSPGYNQGFRFYNISTKPLMEAFINMLETNKTLITIQIPDFVVSAEDIINVLHALEVNQSISNIVMGVGHWFPYPLSMVRYEEFSREDVFSTLLKLIKFRNDHGNGLSMVDVRNVGLERPEFDVHIQGALKKKYYSNGSCGEFFVRPMSCRVFLCGFPEGEKTTLRKKMKYILHEKSKKFHLLYSLSKKVEIPSTRVSKQTIGVEVVTTHAGAVELSLWDLGGQDEYHTYHDLVIPNLSDNGSASLFILVCSMATNKDGAKGSIAKSPKAIELELQYWLRFLSSNTRTSRNLKLPVLVVFTHVDVLPKSMNVGRHVEDLLTAMKHKFGDCFHFSSMEYFVNSHSTPTVEPLVECVAQEVEVVLTKVPDIFVACLEMRDAITKWKGEHPCEMTIKWSAFVHMCWELPWLKKAILHLDVDVAQDICKTIASSLHEGGYIMYFEDVDVIVVDSNWFGTRIIGSIFSLDTKCLDPYTMEPITNEKGYMERDKLVSVLEKSFNEKKGVIKKGSGMMQCVEVDDLICVMKAMNVCFEEHCSSNVEKPSKSIFIPATLRDEGGLSHRGRRKLHWNVIGSSSSGSLTYIGRRLQCADLERTFLTAGFFPRL